MQNHDDAGGAPAGFYYKCSINVINKWVRKCDSLECLVKTADVVKQRLLASGPEDRKRINIEIIPLLEEKLKFVGDATGLVNRGNKYMKFNEPEKALEYYEQALKLNPLSVPALLGSAYAHIAVFRTGSQTEFSRAISGLPGPYPDAKTSHYYPALENIFLAAELAPWNLKAWWVQRLVKREIAYPKPKQAIAVQRSGYTDAAKDILNNFAENIKDNGNAILSSIFTGGSAGAIIGYVGSTFGFGAPNPAAVLAGATLGTLVALPSFNTLSEIIYTNSNTTYAGLWGRSALSFGGIGAAIGWFLGEATYNSRYFTENPISIAHGYRPSADAFSIALAGGLLGLTVGLPIIYKAFKYESKYETISVRRLAYSLSGANIIGWPVGILLGPVAGFASAFAGGFAGLLAGAVLD